MRKLDFPFGYCTNVHAGTHLSEAKSNLIRYAGQVREQVVPDGNLPVGLWLADLASSELAQPGAASEFRDWLGEHHFLPYTFNGFPQGDFHQAVVKHKVYEPSWLEPIRCEHTKLLANILSQLLPDGATGSISTLPLGWPRARWPHKGWLNVEYEIAADHLMLVAEHLAQLADKTGHEIVLAIEPEPGCVLDMAEDIARFFENYLFEGPGESIARKFLTVCHDVCHSAVMFEPQQQVLSEYMNRGIRVGKVQVSSAIEVPWRESPEHRDDIERQLRQLHEPRYLRQTTLATERETLATLAEDLPIALEKWLPSNWLPKTNWRIHFHVPIFVEEFGRLKATRRDIGQACDFLEAHRLDKIADRPWFTGHYEVETYAWPVLPVELRVDDLADGIARELVFLRETFLNR